MDHAIIDLGSNSIRLSVYRCQDKDINPIFSQKEVAGLAGYITNNELSGDGIALACKTLNHLKEIALKFVEPSHIALFATASLRNIANQEEAKNAIVDGTALQLHILQGEEEAALGFVGMSRFMNRESGMLIDIGGASTELVLFRDFQPIVCKSLPIGCLNLYTRYIRHFSADSEERKLIKKAIQTQLDGIDWPQNTQCPIMVGVGGTVRAMYKLSCDLFPIPPEQSFVEADCVKEILRRIKQSESELYHTIGKLIPERALTIFPGLMILRQAIKRFGCERIFVSKFGVREGYLLDRVLKGNAR